jgi:lipopolysaccharide export system permease protein
LTLLDRYLTGRFLAAFPYCLVAAVALFVVFDFFVRVGELAEHGARTADVVEYFAFKTPRVLSQVYPAAMLFAVLTAVGALAEQNEVLAMKACGVSPARMLVPLSVAGACLSVLLLAWNETIVPPAAGRARYVLDVEIRNRLEAGFFNASSLWFRTAQGYVNADYFDATANVLYGVKLHELDASFRVRTVVTVPRATWSDGEWRFERGRVLTFVGAEDMFFRAATPSDLRIDVPPEELRRKRRQSYEMGFGELRRQVYDLRRDGLDAREYVVDLYAKVAGPFAGLVSVMIGLPLAIRSTRRGGLLRNAAIGLGVSFVYWMASAVALAAGHAGTIPPLIAAWAANVVFGAGAFVLSAAGPRA